MTSGLTNDELARLEEFLEPSRIVVVATIGGTGLPQLTPNWYKFVDGRLTISTTKDRIKYKNLLRDSRMTVCIYSEPRAADYVVLSGRATIMDGEEIWPYTEAVIERYVPEGTVAERIERMRTEGRVIISLEPERVRFRNP